jgi:U32 family peptidase
MPTKPELIAPAGNMDCARAAVANGADAIYFGMERFNARIRAANFAVEQIPELVSFVHRHGVKAYCTVNTLIFTKELQEAERQLLFLDHSGVDAVIIQDLGLICLAQALRIRMDIHASTQMTITSPEGVRFVSRLGVNRVILARETSLREMAYFHAARNGNSESDPDCGQATMPDLEVFVHGALCVAYSGQCLTSEALGQRSANRGECAQACRLPYDLVVDGEQRDLGDRRYLLSPQDLAALREIPELLRLGITGFKIEGRLKTPEYVAAATRVYRRAIDEAIAGRIAEPTLDENYQLEMTFTRGFYSGWIRGVNHQRLVPGRFGKKRGPFAGFVGRVGADFVEINPQCALRAGDGIVFDSGGDTNQEQGGRIWEIRGQALYFQKGQIDFGRICTGHRVWKTSDPQLDRELRRSYQGEIPALRISLDLTVTGAAGEPMVLSSGNVRVLSQSPLQKAVKRPLDQQMLEAQLGRLGGTRFVLGRLENRLEGQVILPVSEMNRMRREHVALLESQLEQAESNTCPSPAAPCLDRVLTRIRQMRPSSNEAGRPDPMSVLVRTMEQLESALECDCTRLYADFEDLRRYIDVVSKVRSYRGHENGTPKPEIFLAPPRIQKAAEQGIFRLLEKAAPDGVLVRNLGGLDFFRQTALRCVGDYTLNVANPLTAELLMAQGLERITASYDLNAQQLLDLLQSALPSWFELVIHQHMPLFHMEHCIFAAFLSHGVDHTDCGRPCDRHRLALRDRVGAEHPVKADAGCRNTVFHARAQSGAQYLREFQRAGACHFRIELLDEDAQQTRNVIEGYRALLSGADSNAERLLRKIRAVDQLGVTSGTLTVLSGY